MPAQTCITYRPSIHTRVHELGMLLIGVRCQVMQDVAYRESLKEESNGATAHTQKIDGQK
jgi:hypothetical protein